MQAYSGADAAAPLQHCAARRGALTEEAASAGGHSVSTDHRLPTASSRGGHLLGVTAKPMPRGALTDGTSSSGLQREPMYELAWQVHSTAAPPASLDAGHHLSGFCIKDRSSSAATGMLALLQAADVHRASTVDLLGTEQAHAVSSAVVSSAAHSGGFSGLLRTFAHKSSAAVGSSLTDHTAAGDVAGNRGVRLMVGSETPARVSDVYGSRRQGATQLSAVLLPSTMRSSVGAWVFA